MLRTKLVFTLLSLGLVLSLIACSSAKKRGQEALEKGDYETALQQFDEAVRDDPSDPESQAGLRGARSGVLDLRLIQVRTSRMSGNSDEALRLLLDILALEKQWNLSPSAKASTTQQEETEYANRTAIERTSAALAAGYPLRAEKIFRQYRTILTPGTAQKITLGARKKGAETCAVFRKQRSKKARFFTAFVDHYCGFWNSSPDATQKAKTLSASENMALEMLYGALNVTVKPEGLSPQLQTSVKQFLGDAFSKTAWYSPKGKQIASGSVSGSYEEKKNKVGTMLVHVYKVQEPYTEMVKVEKERTVTYDEYVDVFDPVTQGPKRTLINKSRQEKYTTEEPRIAYRDVEKNHRYPAWKHEQTLSISLSGQIQLGGKTFNFAESERSNTEGIEHDEEQPSMGLHSSKPNLQNPEGWQVQEIQKFAAAFQNQARTLWIDTHCKMSEKDSGNPTMLAEQAVLCIREQQTQAPAYVENWFQKNLGVSAADAKGMLGSF